MDDEAEKRKKFQNASLIHCKNLKIDTGFRVSKRPLGNWNINFAWWYRRKKNYMILWKSWHRRYLERNLYQDVQTPN